MADREKIIRYYKGTEGAETAVRLVDLAEQAMRFEAPLPGDMKKILAALRSRK